MSSNDRQILFFNALLKGLFVTQLCFAFWNFFISNEHKYAIYSGAVFLFIQWIHAGYLGMGQGLDWQQRFF